MKGDKPLWELIAERVRSTKTKKLSVFAKNVKNVLHGEFLQNYAMNVEKKNFVIAAQQRFSLAILISNKKGYLALFIISAYFTTSFMKGVYYMYSEMDLLYSETDDKGRIILASFSNGYRFERCYVEDYKNGDVPYYVVEFMNSEKIYEREGDEILFGK